MQFTASAVRLQRPIVRSSSGGRAEVAVVVRPGLIARLYHKGACAGGMLPPQYWLSFDSYSLAGHPSPALLRGAEGPPGTAVTAAGDFGQSASAPRFAAELCAATSGAPRFPEKKFPRCAKSLAQSAFSWIPKLRRRK